MKNTPVSASAAPTIIRRSNRSPVKIAPIAQVNSGLSRVSGTIRLAS